VSHLSGTWSFMVYNSVLDNSPLNKSCELFVFRIRSILSNRPRFSILLIIRSRILFCLKQKVTDRRIDSSRRGILLKLSLAS
jgi:hypothetical protein